MKVAIRSFNIDYDEFEQVASKKKQNQNFNKNINDVPVLEDLKHFSPYVFYRRKKKSKMDKTEVKVYSPKDSKKKKIVMIVLMIIRFGNKLNYTAP